MTDPDETQPPPRDPAPTAPAGEPASTPPPTGEASASSAPPPSSTPPPPEPDRPLQADPNRPADSGWREPPWIPARARARDRRPNLVALVVGFGLIAFGLYWFVDRTLGINLPDIALGSLWPIVLIVLGGVILVRSLDRRP